MREENGHASHSNGAGQALFRVRFRPGGCRWPVSHWPVTRHPGALRTRGRDHHGRHGQWQLAAGRRPGAVVRGREGGDPSADGGPRLHGGVGLRGGGRHRGACRTGPGQRGGDAGVQRAWRGLRHGDEGCGAAGVYVVVDDVDAHHRRAVEQGVEVLMPPTDQDYGSRDYMVRDVEGNVWTFGTYAPEVGA
ncbi:VOC family protein [Streptomyces albogriseolus]|nr:VOC family protein [Streptomyces albogriseolus]